MPGTYEEQAVWVGGVLGALLGYGVFWFALWHSHRRYLGRMWNNRYLRQRHSSPNSTYRPPRPKLPYVNLRYLAFLFGAVGVFGFGMSAANAAMDLPVRIGGITLGLGMVAGMAHFLMRAPEHWMNSRWWSID